MQVNNSMRLSWKEEGKGKKGRREEWREVGKDGRKEKLSD